MVATWPHGHDLVQLEGVAADGQRGQERLHVADDLVAQHKCLERALHARLEVADIVQQRGAGERTEDGGQSGLQRRLFVEKLAVRHAGVGPAGQSVGACQIAGSLVAERRFRRQVDLDCGAHVEHADAGAVHEGRSGPG